MTTLQRFIHWCVIAAVVFQPLSVLGNKETGQQVDKGRNLVYLSTPGVSTSAACFWADLDCDHDVDVEDVRAAAERWNCATGEACYAANLDRNSDGVIDALDLAYFGNHYDVAPPTIMITSPAEGALTGSATLQVSGVVSAVHTINSVVVNGVTATLGAGAFLATVPISAGNQTLTAVVTDELGKSNAAARVVFVDQTGPFVTVAAPAPRQAVYTLRPTITVSYTDFYTGVNTSSLQVTLKDANGASSNVTSQLAIGQAGATGQPNFDLAQDMAYTLTASLADAFGNPAAAQTTFYVPAQAASLVPPASSAASGWVSGVIYDSARCDGYLTDCAGVAGARVTLAQVDVAALAQARLDRAAKLSQAAQGEPLAAEQVAVTAPISGVIVTGPDGFFAFPVADTARYVVRVEKTGFTYGQRLAEIVQERSTPVNEIYLTPLDAAVTYCTDTGCDHVSADGQLEVIIPPGAIAAGQIVTVTATEFDRVNFLPSGELPPGTWETYAFNLGGDSEITFTQPITVRVKNSKGFAPGEIIPLGYWNQTLLQWEHVTTSTVDVTGQWVEMQVTHFSNYDPNAPVTVNTAKLQVENQTGPDQADCGKDPCGSEITLRGGYLRQNVSLLPIEVLGQAVAPTFNYDSGRADPSEIIDVKLNLTSAPGVELGKYLQAELFIEGEKTANYSFAAPDLASPPQAGGTEGGSDLGRFRFLWDGRNAQGARLPPGIYRYAVRVRVPYRAQWYRSLNNLFGGPPDYTRPMGRALEATADQWVYGSVTLDADPGGPFGLGWRLAGQQRLIEDQSGRILVSDGSGNLAEYYFAAQNQLLPPAQTGQLRPTEVTALHGMYVPEVADQVAGEGLMSNGTINDQLPMINDQLPTSTNQSNATGAQPAQSASADLSDQPEVSTSGTSDLSAVSAPQALIPDPASQIPAPLAPTDNITQNITADTTWTLANSPYTLTTNINVSAGVTLTLEPGVLVKANGQFELSVQGRLVAIGTAAQPITFTSVTNTGANQWRGLVFNGGTGDLQYATVRYAGWANSLGIRSNVTINNVVTGEVKIENSRILTGSDLGAGNDYGVYAQNGRVSISNTLFSGNGNNTSDYALYATGATAIVTLTNSTVQNNLGYALYSSAESLNNVSLINTTFSGNGLNRMLIAGGTTTQTVTLPAQIGLEAYEVAAVLTIPSGALLDVQPGVQVMTRGGQDIILSGRLTAIGTPTQPITFTSATNTAANQWRGLTFNGGTGELKHTTVRYAGWSNSLGVRSNVTVYNVITGEVQIESSRILTGSDLGAGNDYGVYVNNSRVTISDTLFSGNGNNTADYALYAANATSAVTLTNSIIQSNNGYAAHLSITDTQRMTGNTFANNTLNRIVLPDATLAANATLSGQGQEGYELEGDLNVPTGTILTVPPDINVMGRSGSEVLVRGHLQAIGTVTQPITFTSATNTAPSQWNGLQFDGGTGELEYVTVRYAGSGGTILGAANLAARNVVTGQVRIESSRIMSSSNNGVYLLNANVLISGTTVSGNYYPINTTPESMHRLTQINNTLGGNTYNWVFIWPSGTFMGDVTFVKSDGLDAYWIGANTVPATTTLTIEHDLSVIGPTGSGLTVYGTLNALGTPTQPITFTGQDPANYFGAIDFVGANARGTLEHATVLRGYPNGRQAVIVARDGASVTLHNTSVITGATFTVPGILATNNSTLTVEGGQVYRAIRSGISVVNSRADIRGVQLINNGSASDYALDVTGNSVVSIVGNTIASNPGFPVRVPISAAQQLDSNAFINNLTARARLTGDGSLAADLTLGAQNGLTGYEFDGNVTVPASVTLNVGPGATLLWAANKGLTVQGRLNAIGVDTSASGAITFTSLANTGAGQWTGLTFSNGAGRLDYAKVRYATSGLRANNSPIELRYTTIISNSQHGITLTGNSAVSAQGTTIAGNGARPTYYGLLNQTGQLIDARYIWWGSDTGPYHAVKNPGGLGNQVSNNVAFQPWLGAPQQALITSQSSSDDTTLIFNPNDGTYTRRYPDGTLVYFNVLGQHDYTTNPIGQQLRYGYDAQGKTVSMSIVISGEVTPRWVWSFAYAGNPPSTVTITDPAGRVTAFTIDQHGDLISVQEPGLSAPTTFAYDEQHRMTHKRDARGYLTQYLYGVRGRIAQVILPPRPIYNPVAQQFSTQSEVHTFTPSDSAYPPVNSLAPGTPLTPTAPLSTSGQLLDGVSYGNVIHRGQTNAFGAVISATDALSRTTQYLRDDRNRLTRAIQPDGTCTEYTYNANGNRLSEARLPADQCALSANQRDPAQIQLATYTYEPRFNQVKSVTDALGRTIVYTYEYELGTGDLNLLAQTQYPPVADETGVTVTPITTIEYNAVGQVTRQTNLRGIATCYGYSQGTPGEANTIFAPGVTPVPGRLTQIKEDCGGVQERVTTFSQFDPVGNARERAYPGAPIIYRAHDARSRVISETSAVDVTTLYAYDNADNRTQIIQAANTPLAVTTDFAFDAADLIVSIRTARGGQANELRYGHDLNRRRTLTQDANGHPTRYFYDSAGQLTQVIDPLGNTAAYSYDADGRPIAQTDPLGVITTRSYDAFGREWQLVNDAGGLNRTTTSAYDSGNRVITQTDALGVRTCQAYDAYDRVTALTSDCGGLNATTRFGYDLSGHTVVVTDANGHATRSTYDRLDQLIKITDALQATRLITRDVTGNVVAEQDALGRVSQSVYDQANRLITRVDPLNGQTTFTYDALDNVSATTDPLNATSRFEYDAFNRRVKIINPLSSVARYGYDANGNAISVIDPLGRATTYVYDALNRPIGSRDPAGGAATLEYDAAGRVLARSDALQRTTRYAYDALNRQTVITDARGAATTWAYDALGNWRATTDALHHTTRYDYDALYRTTTITDANQAVTRFTYDAAGNRLSVIDPLNNTTTYAYDALNRVISNTDPLGVPRTYGYDAASNLTAQIDRNGRASSRTYDALNRLTTETWAGADRTLTYTYDAASRLIGATDAAALIKFGYDALGRRVQADYHATNAPNVALNYQYDAFSNVTSVGELIAGQARATTAYQYDDRNNVSAIAQSGSGTPAKRVDFAYSAANQPIGLTRYGVSAVATTTIGFDLDGNVTGLTHTLPSATKTLTWAYDALKRVIAATLPDGASTVGYDARGQVISATHTYQMTEAYTYDANGNRAGGGYSSGLGNRLTSDGAYNYTYDGEGNRAQRIEIATGAITQYTYDQRNRLTGVTFKTSDKVVTKFITYTYDALDQRAVITVDADGAGAQPPVTEQLIYDRDQLALTLDATGSVTHRYLNGPATDLPLADETGGQTLWALTDLRGTVNDVINSAGVAQNHLVYDAFGNITSQTSAPRLAYTGREWDSAAGLYFYRSRYYDPRTGAFISPDSAGFGGGDVNLYRYANNSPTNLTDPGGHEGRGWLDTFPAVQSCGTIADAALQQYSLAALSKLYGESASRDVCGWLMGLVYASRAPQADQADAASQRPGRAAAQQGAAIFDAAKGDPVGAGDWANWADWGNNPWAGFDWDFPDQDQGQPAGNPPPADPPQLPPAVGGVAAAAEQAAEAEEVFPMPPELPPADDPCDPMDIPPFDEAAVQPDPPEPVPPFVEPNQVEASLPETAQSDAPPPPDVPQADAKPGLGDIIKDTIVDELKGKVEEAVNDKLAEKAEKELAKHLTKDLEKRMGKELAQKLGEKLAKEAMEAALKKLNVAGTLYGGAESMYKMYGWATGDPQEVAAAMREELSYQVVEALEEFDTARSVIQTVGGWVSWVMGD